MSFVREIIVSDFAKWTALSATRSGSPIKSRKDVYGVLDTVDFTFLFRADMEPIDDAGFVDWHKSAVDEMCKSQPKLTVVWATKIINVYLKTKCYVGGYGRDGLIDVIHPPIDNGLISGLSKELSRRFLIYSTSNFQVSTLDKVTSVLFALAAFQSMESIKTYEQYECIIQACRAFATLIGCSLFEGEQFWEGTSY